MLRVREEVGDWWYDMLFESLVGIVVLIHAYDKGLG